LLTPKIGHRGIGIAGFSIVLVRLDPAAALYPPQYILPFAAAGMLWGHYWDASNCMTIPNHGGEARVPRHRERLCLYVRQVAVFLAIFCSRRCLRRSARPTPRCSSPSSRYRLLAAIFILPEVYATSTIEADRPANGGGRGSAYVTGAAMTARGMQVTVRMLP